MPRCQNRRAKGQVAMGKKTSSLLLGVLATACLVTAPLAAEAQGMASSDEEVALIGLAQTIFDAIASADTSLARTALRPGAQLTSTRKTEAGPETRIVGDSEWLGGIATIQSEAVERMWEPVIHIQGDIAVLWARYDFHVDGVFSHCGTDAFNYVREADGWVITGITWTVETEGCEPSPLGPIGGS